MSVWPFSFSFVTAHGALILCDNEAQGISERALQHAKQNGKSIAAEVTNGYPPKSSPISVFMAGSPGAGKTEASFQLSKIANNMLRIDADELRARFSEYNGSNSHLFQQAVSRLVHNIHDLALKKKIDFLLDGTFAGEEQARTNITRSLKRNRYVFVIFVYQQPKRAWYFVKQRELIEGRRILKEDFAEKFCVSWDVVNKMKKEFGSDIELSLLHKNTDGSDKFHRKNVERIEDHIPQKYSKDQILNEISDSLKGV